MDFSSMFVIKQSSGAQLQERATNADLQIILKFVQISEKISIKLPVSHDVRHGF